MFNYIILFMSLVTLASCTNTEATPSSTERTDSSRTESSVKPNAKVLYVDVREDNEWAAGHVDWALHVKLWDIEAGNFSAIPKDVPVNLYCRSGRRSAIATSILKNAGYTNITDIGGMESVRGVTIVR